jgi:RNA polymerase sigma-70 factor (ECF subfamily)
MDKNNWLAEQFEVNRPHLETVAYRMLGSLSEAEDAVQESWLRLSRVDTGTINNLGGWLTTVVARVCLDMLRSRKSRREESLDLDSSEPLVSLDDGSDPEHEAVMADSVGLALLVVLETLTPAERIAFVLHDLFAVPFEEIGPIVGRSTMAARQLASRARRRVQKKPASPGNDQKRQREVVDAFLSASRNGDFKALLSLLDENVVLRADRATVETGAEKELLGAAAVADTFSGRAKAARLALVDGAVGAVWSQGGQPRVVFNFTLKGGKIALIELLADPARLREMDLEILSDL